MAVCKACGEEARGGTFFGVCSLCVGVAEIIVRAKGIVLVDAIQELKIANKVTDLTQKTSGVVIPSQKTQQKAPTKRKPIRKPAEPNPSYNELEYEVDWTDVFEPRSHEEHLNYLEQMMDAALMGKDIEWAREIYQDIKQLKEQIQ